MPFRVDRTQRRTYASELHKPAPAVLQQAQWCSRWSPPPDHAGNPTTAARVVPRPRSLSPLRDAGLSMSRLRSTQAMLGHTSYLFGEVSALSSGLMPAANGSAAASSPDLQSSKLYAPCTADSVALSPFTPKERQSRFHPDTRPTEHFETMRAARRTGPTVTKGQLTLTKHRHLGTKAPPCPACHAWTDSCGIAEYERRLQSPGVDTKIWGRQHQFNASPGKRWPWEQ